MYELTTAEIKTLRALNTSNKIQNFLDSFAINFEPRGDTCMSPRRVLREKKAHCMEGAMVAALALRLHGHPPLVLDLQSVDKDFDHVVAPFRIRNRWGAISKTNHAVLRYREPIYRDIRELAISYFHEYFTDDGKKTLRSYSRPLDLSRFDKRGWATDEKDVFYVPAYLNDIKHFPILSTAQTRMLRKADGVEIAAGKITEWNRRGKRLFK